MPFPCVAMVEYAQEESLKGAEMSDYKRVFAALDGASSQRTVVEKAIAIASNHGSELVLGHVVDAVMSEASAADMESLAEGIRLQIIEDIADLIDKAEADSNVKSVELKVISGSVPEDLGSILIPQYKPDLVVCCKRGFSGFRYAFVGSVSTYLVRHMDCDVLVIDKTE